MHLQKFTSGRIRLYAHMFKRSYVLRGFTRALCHSENTFPNRITSCTMYTHEQKNGCFATLMI